MTNQELKLKAAGAGVKLWRIAEKLGVTDNTLSRWLRSELPDEKKEKILAIIDELKQEAR